MRRSIRPQYKRSSGLPLRLMPTPSLWTQHKPDGRCNSIVGTLSKGAIYRTGTVLPIWKKTTLSELLAPGESAWDFEICGSVRSDRYDGFYCTHSITLPILNCVIKGKWQRGCGAENASLARSNRPNARPLMTTRETFVFFLRSKGQDS